MSRLALDIRRKNWHNIHAFAFAENEKSKKTIKELNKKV